MIKIFSSIEKVENSKHNIYLSAINSEWGAWAVPFRPSNRSVKTRRLFNSTQNKGRTANAKI